MTSIPTGYRVVCYLLALFSAGAILMSLFVLTGENGRSALLGGLMLLLGGVLSAYSVYKLLDVKITGFTALRISIAIFAVFIITTFLSEVKNVGTSDFVFLFLGIFIISLFYWLLESYMRDQFDDVARLQSESDEP